MRSTNVPESPHVDKLRLAKGLALLADADRLRRRHALPADSRLFLPRMADLFAAGFAPDDLKGLIESGFADLMCQNRDSFVGPAALIEHIGDEAALALTEAGVGALRRSGILNTVFPNPQSAAGGPLVPPVIHYDAGRRELWLDDTHVLWLRSGSRRMEALLAAFQERFWRTTIRHPFDDLSGRTRRQSVRDAVFGLNRRQRPLRIEFHCFGKGSRITYEILDGLEDVPPPPLPNQPR